MKEVFQRIKKKKNNISLAKISKNICIFIAFIFIILGFICSVGFFKKHSKNHYINKSLLNDNEKSVLILSSYSVSYPSANDELRAINNVFTKNNIRYDVEFLKADKYSCDGNTKAMFNFLDFRQKQINEKDYDILIAADDRALEFVRNYYSELFNGIPVIFFGINNKTNALLAEENPNIRGFIEPGDYKKTLNLALSFQKEARNFVIILDDSITCQGEFEKLYQNILPYLQKDFTYEIINTSSESEDYINERVLNLGENDIVFFLSLISMKSDSCSISDKVEFLSINKDIPYYSNIPGLVESGVVLAGDIPDMFAYGKEAANKVVELVNGKKFSDLNFQNETKSSFIVNRDLLRKFSINKRFLPENTQIYGSCLDILIYYFHILYPFAFFLIAAIFLIVAVNIAYRSSVNYAKELEASKNRLFSMRYNDDITGLPNKASCFKYLDSLENMYEYSIIMIYLDGFRNINENFGYETGDIVLKKLSSIIYRYMDESGDFVGKVTGASFCIFHKGKLSSNSSLIEKIINDFSFTVNSSTVSDLKITVSLGIYNIEKDCPTVENAMINAELALYESKTGGSRNCTFYEPKLSQKSIFIMNIENTLINAIENNAFYMVYQPKVRTSDKKVVGYEALIRLKDNSTPSSTFIPAAERLGYINEIGRLTTELVIKQMAKWKKAGMKLLPISINFSNKQLCDDRYVFFLRELLDKYNISPSLIEIEITENIFMNKTGHVIDIFRKFHNMGIKIAIDDFGIGYTGIGYFDYIPIDTVKLDKSIVDMYLNDEKDYIVKNLINFFSEMDMKTVVEGVEYKWQYEKLKNFSADAIQGYYFSKPLKAENVPKWAKEYEKSKGENI